MTSRNASEWDAPPKIADAQYVDNRIYTDEEIYREEQEKIFSKVWKFSCHESEMAEIGDFRTVTVAGKPLFHVRGDDGEIRTFYNVCPHRGAEILRQPAGNGKTFTCLFHHWTFDRQGECVSITMPKGYEECGLDAKDCGLREVKTEVKYGFVFINLDDNCDSLDAFLGDSLETVTSVLGAGDLEVFHFHRAVVPSNWKLWVDTDREIYHEFLHVVNRTTSFMGPGYFDADARFYKHGHFGAEPVQMGYEHYDESRRKSRNQPLPGLNDNESRLVDLFPDMMINIRTTAIRLDSIIPLSPTHSVVEYRGLGVKGESAENRKMRINDHNEYWGPFGRNLPEDTVAVATQMKTMNEASIPYSIFARDGNPPRFNDATARVFYEEWSRLMGRPAHNPMNEPRRSAAE